MLKLPSALMNSLPKLRSVAPRQDLPESLPDVRADALPESPASRVAERPNGAHATLVQPYSASRRKMGRAVTLADMVEVRDLIETGTLTSFRVYRCFEYCAGLYFHETELTYYVTLHQEQVLSRALNAPDIASADLAFQSFEAQVSRLSAKVAQRVQLEAENRHVARMIAQSQIQVERMHENLREGSAQARATASRQHQLRKEVAQLEAQLASARAYLGRIGREKQRLALISNKRLPYIPT